MYNRYTPRQDGGFNRDRIPERSDSPPQNQPRSHTAPNDSSPSAEHTAPHAERAHVHEWSDPHGKTSSATSFLAGLLPKNMDTGDLLMLLILLLLITDGSEDAPDPLLTIALFFLME